MLLTFIGVPRDTTWSAFLRTVGVAFVGATALIAVGLLLSIPTPLAAGRHALELLAELHDDRLSWIVRRISGLGNVWVVGAACALAAAILHQRRSPLAGEVRLLVIGTFGGALVITAPLKLLTDRARPSGALVGTLSSSYPSGHALRTAAVYGLLVWLISRLVRSTLLRWTAMVAVVLLMVAIATARVYLWAHWPSDVLVGLALGSVWLVILLRVTRPLRPARDEGLSAPRRVRDADDRQ